MNHRITNIGEAKSILFLTGALIMLATWGVGAAGWTNGINILTFVGLGVILIGVMLARSLLPALVAHIFSLIIGVSWSFWITSRLLPTHYTWPERWHNLAARLQNWYFTALHGGTSYDNLMFILQMGVILWVMGYLAIWFVFRSGKPWPAVVPGGLVLLINLYYIDSVQAAEAGAPSLTFYFILYLITALLLVVRFNLFDQQHQWRREGVFFRPDINFDFLRDGFIFALLVVAFAWITPPFVNAKTLPVLDEYHLWWSDVQEQWNRLFANLNYRNQSAGDTFGGSLRLGGARQLNNTPVMDVRVSGAGRYWRAAVYDYYTGDGWLTRDEDKANFGPEAALELPVFEMRQAVTQTYTLRRDNATVLYAMSSPVYFNRPTRVNFFALPAEQVAQAAIPGWLGRGEVWAAEITYVRSNATVDNGESYQAVSLASRATATQLAAAGADYPAWVTDRYLNLPPSITARTRELARQITAGTADNFAKAQSIEQWLRQNIKYNDKIAAPPAGLDKVDYFLFTLKEGYCDYYATAMIVMLRSLGIPARLAAGFAQGTFNPTSGAFEVLNRDAHSWVEVYFPRYGWLEFEPTASQPAIVRTAAADAVTPPAATVQPENAPGNPHNNIPIDDEAFGGGKLPFGLNYLIPLAGRQISWALVALGAGVIILTGAALAGGVVAWRRQSARLMAEAGVVGLYRRMVKLAGWMGIRLRPWQTPFEHAGMLQRALPQRRQEIETIAGGYVTAGYGNPHTGNPDNIQPDEAAWQRLRPAMLRQTLWRRLPRWLQK